jgi:ABC-2 type transport system permease protein
MPPDTLTPARPDRAAEAARDPRAGRYRQTWVITRHTSVLLARDPGIVLTYAVMSAVLLVVLRPVYTRLAAPGTPSILQETPGMAVFFTLLALDMAGQVMLSERTWNTWDRLRASRAGSLAVLTGKALPLTGVFFLQQTVLFAFAAAAFGLDLPAGAWRLPVMGVCWAMCVTTCGLALGVWVRTQGQLAAIADIVALLITCLSGCLVPLPILPGWVRAIAPYSPGYWASRGFQASVTGDLRVYGQAVAVVLGVAAAGLAIAAIRAPRSR